MLGRALISRAAAALCLLSGAALALYADEAGEIDWYRQQIGEPTRMVPYAVNGTGRLAVITQRGVVASLDAESGAIRWRQVLGDGAELSTLQVSGGRVLTQAGTHVHVWEADGGAMEWGYAGTGEAGQSMGGASAAFVGDASDEVVAVVGGQLVRAGADGTAWTVDLNGTYTRVVQHEDTVYALGNAMAGRKEEKRQVRVVAVDAATGAVQQQYNTCDGQWLGGGSAVVLQSSEYGAYVVWRERDNIVWNIHRLGLQKPAWEIFHAKVVQMELMPEDMLGSTLAEIDVDPELNSDKPRFTMTYTKNGETKTVVVEMFRTGDRLDMRKVVAVPGRRIAAAPRPWRALAEVQGDDKELTWRVAGGSGSKSKSDRTTVAYDSTTYGAVSRVTAVFQGVDGAARVVVQTRGGLVVALAAGSTTALWTRDEALAHARDLAFVDSSDQDHFGFQQRAVFGSDIGTVVAVDTQDGTRAWARNIADGARRVAIEKVFAMPNDRAVVVGRSTRNRTVVAALDTRTGEVSEKHTADFVHARAFMVDDSVGLAVDGAQPRLELWPSSDAFCASTTPFYFVLGDVPGSTRVRGYHATCEAGAVVTRAAWTFDLPEGEELVTSASHSEGSYAAALAGRVQEDRTVRYKYLSPHVGTLATRSSSGVAVYVIDRVSGRLLHQAAHYGARVDAMRPLLAVQAENRIVYQFWQDFISEISPARGYVTAVIDLFESDRSDERDERTTVSSLDLRLPSVATAAFSAPEPATALGVTRTRAHIATRDVLFGLRSGKLLALPEAAVDPLPAEGKADGAPRPLVVDPKRVLSHGNGVAGIHAIRSAPTHLESTALVAAFGLDLFFTRTSPSGSFDQLSPSFSKANLAITTLALALGCLVARPFVRRKLINRAWA
ncbi:hypothetical protein GGF46_002153 [Coemansia sp. RSA 552]|nr:hypothetical protein GGF46_002153 [Coemansia sp. RSA 552]